MKKGLLFLIGINGEKDRSNNGIESHHLANTSMSGETLGESTVRNGTFTYFKRTSL